MYAQLQTFRIDLDGSIQRRASQLPSAVKSPAVSVSISKEIDQRAAAHLLRQLARELECVGESLGPRTPRLEKVRGAKMVELHRCPDGPIAELIFYECKRRREPQSLHIVRTKRRFGSAMTTHRISAPVAEVLAAIGKGNKAVDVT